MMKITPNMLTACPIPIRDYPKVLLAHGGGGKLMNRMIETMFRAALGNEWLDSRHDASVFQVNCSRMAFTTDSYVVNPLFFPGGDIGSLAVHGTVNDLAMSGARPLYLSLGLIIEEGLDMETLWRIIQSIKHATEAAQVKIITGDTKVVNRGKADGIFINTSGVGALEDGVDICPQRVRPGDVVIVNGDLGRHGIAIMATREGLEFESDITSDSAPLWGLVQEIIENDIEIHCLRDLTRGGLSSALNEIASVSGYGIHLEETRIPVREDVRGACEMLGLDPLYVACEGRFAVFVHEKDAEKTLELIRRSPGGESAAVIGTVLPDPSGFVTLKSRIGAERIVDMLSGEQLPRIC